MRAIWIGSIVLGILAIAAYAPVFLGYSPSENVMVVFILAIVAQAGVFGGYWWPGRNGEAPVARKVAISIRAFGGLTLLGIVVWVLQLSVRYWRLFDFLVVFVLPVLFQCIAIPLLLNRPRRLLVWCLGLQAGFWCGVVPLVYRSAHLTHASDLGEAIANFMVGMAIPGMCALWAIVGPFVFLPLALLWTHRATAKKPVSS